MVNEAILATLYKLKQHQLDDIILKESKSVRYLITAATGVFSYEHKVTIETTKHLIRLFLIVSKHVGGLVFYMPCSTDKAKALIDVMSYCILNDKFLSADDVKQIKTIKANHSPKWFDDIQKIIKVISKEIKKIPLPLEQKKTLIMGFSTAFLLHFSAGACYYPSWKKTLSIIRAEAICNEFRGNNLSELSIKYDVNVSSIYVYLRNKRKELKYID